MYTETTNVLSTHLSDEFLNRGVDHLCESNQVVKNTDVEITNSCLKKGFHDGDNKRMQCLYSQPGGTSDELTGVMELENNSLVRLISI